MFNKFEFLCLNILIIVTLITIEQKSITFLITMTELQHLSTYNASLIDKSTVV